MPAKSLPRKRVSPSTATLLPEGYQPSVSNSSIAADVFAEAGVTLSAYAKAVKESLTAQKSIYNKNGKEVAVVPDRQARQWAAEQIRDIHGAKFQPEQKQQAVSMVLVNIVNEISETPVEELRRRAKQRGLID